MCEKCVPADLYVEIEVETMLAEMEYLVMAKEADAGLSVPEAVRPLTENEVAAQVHFGDIAALQDNAVEEAQKILENLREVFIGEIAKSLPATEMSESRFAVGSAAQYLLELSQRTPQPVADAIEQAGADLSSVFNRVYRGSIGIVGDEIQRQGIRVAEGLSGLNGPDSLLEAQGYASALHHWNRLTSKLVENHATPGAILSGKTDRASILDTIDKTGLAGALDTAKQGVHTAHGAGRIDAAGMQGCSDIWASELLDGRTCPECKKVDGKDYTSMAAARLDYPAGGYMKCEGGARCRGTLVFMYADPVPNSGVDADGNVVGHVELPIGPQREYPSIVDEWPSAVDRPKPAPGAVAAQVATAVAAIDVALGGYATLDEVFKGAGFYGDATSPDVLAKRAVWENLQSDFAQSISGELPEGYSMRLRQGAIIDNVSAKATYDFIGPDGVAVGFADRAYTFDPKAGVRSVDHSYFRLEAQHQGHGISSRFLAASEDFYRKLGLDQITIHANIDVGGYAWARAGFDFKNANAAEDLAGYIEYRASDLGLSAADKLLVEELVERLEAVTDATLRTDAITPFEVAMAGYTPGATSWLGKTLMLGSDWYGRKAL